MKRRTLFEESAAVPRTIGRKQNPSKYEIIWDLVSHIPKGCIVTYGQVAHACGFPRQARLIGYALHNLPAGSDVPWHRVINARGEISFPPESVQYAEQLRRLRKEGIFFVKGKTSLARFAWKAIQTSPRQK